MAREQELERIERERIEKEVQERLDKERQEREAREKLARQQELEKEKERAEKERIEKEVQARVERERLERERREKLAREQELERERAVKEKQAAEERHKQEIQEEENEILARAEEEKKAEEAREQLAQMERALDSRNGGKEAQGAGGDDDGEALKNGGRDLKENLAARADHGDGAGVGGVNAEAPPQGSQEKVRDPGEMDLRRRRRALGPGEAGGTPEETGAPRGVPGLEPLLELGGSDLHAALEEQLLAGAMVHSRQIKQASENEGAK